VLPFWFSKAPRKTPQRPSVAAQMAATVRMTYIGLKRRSRRHQRSRRPMLLWRALLAVVADPAATAARLNDLLKATKRVTDAIGGARRLDCTRAGSGLA
jgi:hypothetical protein